jgi:hypothetical protein
MATLDAPPLRATAGDTWSWRWASADYPASAGWANAWRLVGTGVALSVSAVAENDGFVAMASAADTAALTIGARGVPVTLIGWVSKAGERFQVYSGGLFILPNPATITGDLRGHATRTLAAIEAMLEGSASKDQRSIKIGDREIARIPIPELLSLKDYYAGEARREAEAAALASGRPRRRIVLTRMGRA